MPFEIEADLPPALVPLAWLLGRWEGAGVVGYPTTSEYRFGQEVEFRHDGRPFLHYTSHTWLLDENGEVIRQSASETGYWRVPAVADPEAEAKKAPGVDVEVLLAHPTGYVELYYGRAASGKIELSTDLVARTVTAKEYNAATRMYGLVDGDLLWVMDMAAMGQAMGSHASARLKKVAAEAG